MEVKMRYPVAINKDPKSNYGVTIPDLPGCFSSGSTIDEAIEQAREAAECHIEGMLLDSEPVPVASDIDVYRDKQEYENAIWAFVEIDISKLSLKSKRVNITMPERLLNTVDHYARKHGETRSGLLAHAVAEYMATHYRSNDQNY